MMRDKLKKYWLLILTVALTAIAAVVSEEAGTSAVRHTWCGLLSFMFMVSPVFVCVGLLDAWVEKGQMAKLLGEAAGLKGRLAAVASGMVTAVPVYALFPVAAMLLRKGSSISNVLIFIGSSAGMRIPLLLFEVSAMGWRYMLSRLVLNAAGVFLIAFVTERALTAKDRQAVYQAAEKMQ